MSTKTSQDLDFAQFIDEVHNLSIDTMWTNSRVSSQAYRAVAQVRDVDVDVGYFGSDIVVVYEWHNKYGLKQKVTNTFCSFDDVEFDDDILSE